MDTAELFVGGVRGLVQKKRARRCLALQFVHYGHERRKKEIDHGQGSQSSREQRGEGEEGGMERRGEGGGGGGKGGGKFKT